MTDPHQGVQPRGTPAATAPLSINQPKRVLIEVALSAAGGPALDDYLRDARAGGVSYAGIARDLGARTRIAIAHETIRRWWQTVAENESADR